MPGERTSVYLTADLAASVNASGVPLAELVRRPARFCVAARYTIRTGCEPRRPGSFANSQPKPVAGQPWRWRHAAAHIWAESCRGWAIELLASGNSYRTLE